MVEGFPRKPSIVLRLPLLVLSYVGSFHEQLYKRSLKELGNGKVPKPVSEMTLELRIPVLDYNGNVCEGKHGT